MEDGPDNETRAPRRFGRGGSAIALLGIVAGAGIAGILISRGQNQTPQDAPLRALPTPPPTAPLAGAGIAVADDPATHTVVVFGGVGDEHSTWLWTGTRWTLAHPSSSPPARFDATAAYDPQDKTVLVFGGLDVFATPLHDTWAWNGRTWMALDSGAGGPRPGLGSMAWDAAHDQMVLVTGSGAIGQPSATWIWAGTHWRQPAGGDLPASALDIPMSFDPVSQSLLALACCEGRPPASGGVDTTWRWDGARWRALSADATVSIDTSMVALDPASGRLVLCACGASVPTEPTLSAWDGTRWDPVTAARLPIEGGVEAVDVSRGELLLLGSPPVASQPGPLPMQVWTLSGSSWHRLDRPASG